MESLRPLDPHAPVSIGVRELLLHAGGESTHLVPGLIQRDLLAQARDHAERVVAAVLRGIHRQRDEDLPRAGRSDLRASDLPKRGRHDADDLVADTVQGDRLTDHRRISAKRAYPQRLREQGDGRRARVLILCGQRSPGDRRDAEHLEQRRGDGTPENPFRITTLGEGEVPAVEGGQCVEAPSALDPR